MTIGIPSDASTHSLDAVAHPEEAAIKPFIAVMNWEIISRTYSKVFRTILSVNFYDAQCGFKFAKKEAVLKILDNCKDEGWFFDTEILYKAEKNNLSICELPVTWIDDPDSKVNIVSTIIKDLIGLVRLRLEKNGWKIWHNSEGTSWWYLRG